MTIKSEEDSEQRWCKKTKRWFKRHAEDFGAVFVVGLFLGLMSWGINTIFNWGTSNTGQELAKALVRKDYPAVMCLSNNGQFRVYDTATYTVYRHKDNGWNIYWTKKGPTDSASFHLGKCEIK